eukprot:1410106-Pyramimonas_sp.AAC.1
MVSACISLPPNFSRSFERRRVAPYDRKGTENPEKVTLFKRLLSQLPPVPFAVDPTSHCYLRQIGIQEAAACAFPKPKTQKRNDAL